jgi:hypothetical protein
VDVASGHLLVTVARLRTSRPVVEYAVTGASPEPPTEPLVEPIEATPTFVG